MKHIEYECKAFDGLGLYFQGWQVEQAQRGVICLTHGLGEHSARYTQWATWLNEAGYSVLSYDLRGHGRSEGLRGHVSSYDDYLRDTDLLISEAKKQFPGGGFFLYGHSLGAIIVSDYVLNRKPKISGAILSALSLKSSLQEQPVKILLAKVLGTIYPKFTLKSGLDPNTLSKDKEVVSKYVSDPLIHDLITASWGKGSLDTIGWINTHASEWAIPVLIMHGEKDQLGYAEGSREFASKITADCTLKIWSGLLHEIHNEPENRQVFEFLRQWLDEHTAG